MDESYTLEAGAAGCSITAPTVGVGLLAAARATLPCPDDPRPSAHPGRAAGLRSRCCDDDIQRNGNTRTAGVGRDEGPRDVLAAGAAPDRQLAP